MTRQPWTITSDATLEQARQLMREHQIRHLPVLEGGKLAGIVSERDLHRRADDPQARVRDAMTVDVLVAGAKDPLDRVVEEMSDRKYGSTVVLGSDGRIEGILTTVDGLRFLAELLERVTS